MSDHPARAENAPAGEELARFAASLAHEIKAVDTVALDLRGRSPFTDFFVVTSGRSDRQVKAIVDHVCERFKKAGVTVVSVEGTSRYEWVIVDAVDVVVHVFYGPVRQRYDLESLWADAPVLELALDEPDAPTAG